MSKTFDVWMEGYAASGDSADATLLASGVEADDFAAAVEIVVEKHKLEHPTEVDYWGKRNDGSWAFYACRLFQTEAEARKSFG
ncbi:MAG: hypothetical protein JWR51_4709 [Devosia sp.]|uniref:hypothetical protein n=1 Tax=Devosia sp. TaxID=1871048 RepID=UPI002610C254|nr:hypothetical protein [Devosia sp.]MDB5531606.1 hypothetical protein [Devosia sp.]